MSENKTWNVLDAPGGRGLLVTVLGEFVRPGGGTVWTQTLIEVLALVGVREKAARQMIARLHDNGWLDRRRVGRRTRWSLTPWADRLLGEGAERIYRFGRDRPAWDQRWLVLIVSIPEHKRPLRYRLNVGLDWAGFGSLGQGTWVAPRVDREQEIVHLVSTLGIEQATMFRAELGQLGRPVDVAARAWDLAAIAGAYQTFLDANRPTDHIEHGDDALRQLLLLVQQWRQFPSIDPDLPAELLPADFPASSGAERFRELRQALLTAAWERWDQLEAGFGGRPA